jgi:hypothetical protein
VKALRDKYDNPALRRFIRPVVKAVPAAAHSHEDEDSALSRIRVALQPGIEVNASDVKESTSVIVTLDVGGREVTLATSTRYEPSELIGFAVRFGWQAVCRPPPA